MYFKNQLYTKVYLEHSYPRFLCSVIPTLYRQTLANFYVSLKNKQVICVYTHFSVFLT